MAAWRSHPLALLLPMLLARRLEGLLNLEFLTALYPGAVCTDGSQAGYYWEAATSDEGRNTWIVHLESGGWCWDLESCVERCNQTRHRCSSTGWELLMNGSGILSNSDPDAHPRLRTANKAFLRYCTSDAHMGDAAAFGFQFRGQRVVQALLSDLVARRGLGAGLGGQRDLLLFGGNSAGSRGAMVHLDYVPSMLGGAAANVKLAGFLDSPLWVDVQPLVAEDEFAGFAKQAQMVFGFINVTHLGEECAAAFSEAHRWKCIFGQYRLPYVRTPHLLVGDLQDGYQLMYDVGNDAWVGPESWGAGKWTEEQLDWADTFALRTAKLMEGLVSDRRVVLAPACHSHAESLFDDGFYRHAGDSGVTINDALLFFLNLTTLNASDTNGSMSSAYNSSGSPPEANANGFRGRWHWIDNCRGLDCGRYCRRGDAPCTGPASTGEGCDAVYVHELDGAPRTRLSAAVLLLLLAALAAASAWLPPRCS